VSVQVAVVTVSDRSSRGEREDISGPVLIEEVKSRGAEVPFYEIVSDDPDDLGAVLKRLADVDNADVILTTGGTGLAHRDNTPDVTAELIDRVVPGFAEAMRTESIRITPHGMLSRAVSGARGETLIINMPGSPKAVKEMIAIVWPAVPHAVDLLHDRGLEDHTPKAQ